ncbi:hypothetical protein MGH68_12080 [Erysipelothrix sp. D19-032]
MKVTYEEAMESFTKLSLDGRKNADILLSFIEQHKPPTQDEITDIWKKLGYEVSFRSSNHSIAQVSKQNRRIRFSDKGKHIYFDHHHVTEKELRAIELTIDT